MGLTVPAPCGETRQRVGGRPVSKPLLLLLRSSVHRVPRDPASSFGGRCHFEVSSAVDPVVPFPVRLGPCSSFSSVRRPKTEIFALGPDITVQGFAPSPQHRGTRRALVTPLPLDLAAHRASSAATTSTLGFEVLIRGEIASSTARLPLDGLRFPSAGLPLSRCSSYAPLRRFPGAIRSWHCRREPSSSLTPVTSSVLLRRS